MNKVNWFKGFESLTGRWAFLAAVAVAVSLTSEASDLPSNSALRTKVSDFITPLPAAMPGAEKDSATLVALGKDLYFEVALSENKSQSCNTCHRVDAGMGGVDNEATSLGAFGKRGGRNSPTTLNAGFQFAQFWDGRAEDLVAQAKGPVLNPVEMAMPSEAVVVSRLKGMPRYQETFPKAFPGVDSPISYDNMAKAIAAFERTLVTRDRFDDFLKGDDAALNELEKRGLNEFITLGCTSCHYGPAMGGQLYQKVGLIHPYSTDDKGRHDVTKDEDDLHRFKVPLLRNIGITQPYFHNGKVATLEDAVRKMAWHQLGRELTESQVTSLVAFLHSLTDKPRAAAKK